MSMKKAFSLAETLITLLIIAVLVTIMMPIINKAKPDENELMHKKATFIVDRVVNEIVTDEFLYPKNGEIMGLGNLSEVIVNGQKHSGETKFCTLFASRINKASGTGVNCTDNGEKSITSAEGIDWYLPVAKFDAPQMITVDVNGDKKPNCLYNQNSCKRPDQFVYQVQSGTRIAVKEVGNLPPTVAPGARPPMAEAPNGGDDTRTGQRWYKISCRVYGNGTVFGTGENKPNGHYQLVAIPGLGYKGDWFTKNVTVNNADVTDCSVTFTPFSCSIPGACPQPDGPPPVNPPVNPVDPPTEKKYCINISITGEKDQCAYGGDGCKPVGEYTVTASSKPGYKPSWKEQKVNLINKDVNLIVNCEKEDVPDKCYSIKVTGDTTNCPVTLPAGTCKEDKTKYINGTYDVTVTPKNNYKFGEGDSASANPTTTKVLVADKDGELDVKCNAPSPLPPVVDIYLEDTFDGLWQEPLYSNYYHVYVKNYFYNRTLKVNVPNVFVKLKITGKYVGENNKGGSLTLRENGIDSKFTQPLTQEFNNNSTARWQSFQELGNGGAIGSSKHIRSVWEKYSVTINDKVLAENKTLSSPNAVDEYKIGDTTFKLHFVDAPRYMVIVNSAVNDSVSDVYNTHGYAWITAKTNVVNAASGGGHIGVNGTRYYTYLEPNGAHLAHKGDTVYVTGYTPYTDYQNSSRIVYPINVTYNGSVICIAQDFKDGGVFDCDHSFPGGNSYPSMNYYQINHMSCQKDEYRSDCCSGGNPCFPYLN